MSRWTQRQEKFCLLIIKGEPQYAAYEQAGYNVKSRAVADANASKLLKTPKIQKRMEELRSGMAKRSDISLDTLTERLVRTYDAAMVAGSFGPAVQAVGVLAKMYGLMIDKSEVTVHHRPAPLPTKVLELTEAEWVRQFGVEGRERTLKVVSGK